MEVSMVMTTKLKYLLDSEHVSYEELEHQPTYTALETAQAQHLPGRQVVKPVIVEADGDYVMCVLPSTRRIDFNKLAHVLGVQKTLLAEEALVSSLFPDCETGAEPPFGLLAGLKVYVDNILEENDKIAFNDGSHSGLVQMKFKDYVRLARPIFGDFSTHIE
jgi:Ala-tRNA(Pro) deacylase